MYFLVGYYLTSNIKYSFYNLIEDNSFDIVVSFDLDILLIPSYNNRRVKSKLLLI